MKYAYLRVSTEKQILERQEELMKQKGIEKKNWFLEKVSGGSKCNQRPQFDLMIHSLQPNDTIYFESMSRMGRNLEDLINTSNYLLKDKKVNIEFIKEGLTLSCDERQTPMQIAMFNMFGMFYQFQKDVQNDLIRDSLAVKKAQGIILGRPKKFTQEQLVDIKEMYEKRTSLKDLSKMFNVSMPTIISVAKECGWKRCEK